MKNKFAKLIDVKSIVTLIMTIVFACLSAKGTVSSDQFLTIFRLGKLSRSLSGFRTVRLHKGY